MNKKIRKILLVVLCIIQIFAVGAMLIYQQASGDKFKEKGVLVTVAVDLIWYDESGLQAELNVEDIHPMAIPGDNYLVFENVENQRFSQYYTSRTKPEHDVYITHREVYNLNNVLIDENTEIGEEYGWWSIYDHQSEINNIYNGYCEGPETEAYALIRVYKGEFQLEEIYIAGYPIEEYAELCIEGKIDLSRYDYNYDSSLYEIYGDIIDDIN